MEIIQVKLEDQVECRACFQKITEYEGCSVRPHLVKVFTELTSLVPPNTGDPVQFCMDCQALLVSFQRFKKLCLQTHQLFLNKGVLEQNNYDDQITEMEVLEDEVQHSEELYTDNANYEIKYDELKIEEIEKVVNACTANEVRSYVCDLCSKQCKTKQGMCLHMERHHMKQGHSSVYRCEYENCGKRFFCKMTFDGHLRTHEGKNPFECELCGIVLATSRNLKRHLETHGTEKNYHCSYCDAKFVTQQSLYSHEKCVHKTGRQYVCSICAYTCYNPTAMNAHTLRHHSGQAFQCDQCPKTCKTPADLKEHKRLHLTVKPNVPCAECGRLFKHRKNMLTHVRLVHVAQRKFKCETCGMSFKSPGALKRHMFIHTGEKMFSCEYCNQGFTQLQALKRHITTHTGVRPYACPHCNHTFAEAFYMRKHAARCTSNTQVVSQQQ